MLLVMGFDKGEVIGRAAHGAAGLPGEAARD